MLLRLDTAVKALTLVEGPARVLDRNREHVLGSDGAPLFYYRVLAVGGGRPLLLRVKAPAASSALEEGQPVEFDDLAGFLYERDGIQRVSFRAKGVRPATPGKGGAR